jgi:hypothetical protein
VVGGNGLILIARKAGGLICDDLDEIEYGRCWQGIASTYNAYSRFVFFKETYNFDLASWLL